MYRQSCGVPTDVNFESASPTVHGSPCIREGIFVGKIVSGALATEPVTCQDDRSFVHQVDRSLKRAVGNLTSDRTTNRYIAKKKKVEKVSWLIVTFVCEHTVGRRYHKRPTLSSEHHWLHFNNPQSILLAHDDCEYPKRNKCLHIRE
jgi:hypothetical protein